MDKRALAAEFVGTFMLVASILGAALFAFPNAGILGVAFAAGLSVMAMIYAVGQISGGHFNSAVTLGLVAAGRFPASSALGYVIAQCAGAIAAALVFYFIASGKSDFAVGTFASNMYGGANGYPLISVFVLEALLTAFFVFVIAGVTRKGGPSNFAPIAIGLALTIIHIIAIPVSNASVNPARSLGTAIIAGGEPLAQLWVFWVAPILGAVLGGLAAKCLLEE